MGVPSIRHAREELGITAQEFSQLLGVTPSAVSYWETGARHPKLRMQHRIAGILGVTWHELFGQREDAA